MKVIVGLGNPVLRQAQDKDKYSGTRHNLGFMVVDTLAKKLDGGSWLLDKNLKSEVIKIDNLLLVKPQTYMNNSGMAVLASIDYFKVPPEDLIIIHDDLDLPLGKIKVRLGGAAAGHHGVESVITALGTDQFIRIRLGIGVHVDAEKFVLEPFLPQEKAKVKHMIKQAIYATQLLLEKGLTIAQNQYN